MGKPEANLGELIGLIERCQLFVEALPFCHSSHKGSLR